MLKHNKNGFTLIELLVSISILAICSTMLILGIFNMVNIFSEGSLIKTNTNTIYNDIVAKIGSTGLTYNDSYTLTLKGSTSIDIKGFSDITDKVDSPTTIKLSYLDPKLKALKLPEETEEPEPPVEAKYSAQISFLENPAYLPTIYNRFTGGENPDDKFFSTLSTSPVENCIINKIVPGSGSNYLFGPSVKLNVLNNPENAYINLAYSLLSPKYKSMLGSSYSVRYSALIEYEVFRTLFCYFVPNQKGIYVKYENPEWSINDKMLFVWIPWTSDKAIINNAIPSALTIFETTGVDSTVKRYTRDELLSLIFTKDFDSDETFFSFYGS